MLLNYAISAVQACLLSSSQWTTSGARRLTQRAALAREHVQLHAVSTDDADL